jgi:hypothetical protein
MTKHSPEHRKQPNPSSSEPAIKEPTAEELEEVGKNLALDAAGAVLITNYVRSPAIEVKGAVARGDHDLSSLRRRRRNFLQKLSFHLSTFTALLKNPDATILRGIIGPQLGSLLSTHAFELLVNHKLGANLSPLDLEMAKRNNPRSGLYQVLEREVERERQGLALRFGDRALANVIQKLADEIERIVQADAAIDKGGRPAKPIRRYVLWRLVELHNRFCGLYGEAWTRERYLELAEQVLPVLGQKTDGLEKAVEKYVGKL